MRLQRAYTAAHTWALRKAIEANKEPDAAKKNTLLSQAYMANAWGAQRVVEPMLGR